MGGRIVPLDYPKAAIRMAVSTEIELKYRAGACAKEPWTVEFIEGMTRGDVLWDVGANVGSYSLLAAALGHDVVAIEPSLANFQALLANGQLNPNAGGRIYGVNAALGATTARIPYSQHSTAGDGEGGGLVLEVQQITIDELVATGGLPAPTHLKIDVDGHELAVLAGARRSLLEGALRAVLVEVQLSLGERVSDYLDGLGWTRTAIFDRRGGNRIAGIRYEQFIKTRVKAEVGPDAGAGEPSSAILALAA